jgi:hypothetical protein
LKDRIVLVSAAVVAVALVIAVIWSANTADHSTAEPATSTTTTTSSATGEQAIALDDVEHLDDVVGRRVVADHAEVESVPGDEGFWVVTGGETAWVQLSTAGESPYTVRAGDRVSFTGDVVAHGADFAQRPEFSGIDAQRLVDAKAHIEVPVGGLSIDS